MKLQFDDITVSVELIFNTRTKGYCYHVMNIGIFSTERELDQEKIDQIFFPHNCILTNEYLSEEEAREAAIDRIKGLIEIYNGNPKRI